MSLLPRQTQTAFGSASASANLTFGSAVLVGSTIIVITSSQLPVASVTDNKGNSYSVDARGDDQGVHIGIFRAFVVTGGSSFTVTAATGGVGRVAAAVAEVPNVLIVNQTNAAATLGTYLQISLSGQFAQSEDVYAVGGGAAASSIAGAWVYVPPGWGMLVGTPDVANPALACFHESLSWSNTSGGLVLNTNPEANVTGLVVLCMATYIEAVVASFSGTPTSGAAPLSVVFTDASTGSPDHWLYEFGDGQTSGAQNPTHQYAADGTYTVRESAWRFDTPVSQQTRASYITVGGGGSGGGGTPTQPGIPNDSPQMPQPGYPAPPIPGAPWMAQSMIPKPPEPPAPEAPTVAAGLPPLVPGNAKASDGARQERANRVLASIHDGLEREQQKPRSGENDFYLLGTGFESAAAPTTSDDETIGASAGATWVHTDEDGTVTLYICFDATAGAADWQPVDSDESDSVGGLSGTFP